MKSVWDLKAKGKMQCTVVLEVQLSIEDNPILSEPSKIHVSILSLGRLPGTSLALLEGQSRPQLQRHAAAAPSGKHGLG